MTDIKTDAIKTHIAKNPKLVKRLINIYNKMDNRCKQLCRSRPGRPMSDYCPRCQEMMRNELGGSI